MAAGKPARAADNGNAPSRADIDMGLLPELIGFNLRCAQLALFQHFSATVGKDGI